MALTHSGLPHPVQGRVEPPPTPRLPGELRPLLLCCALTLSCVLVAWPFRPIAFHDDWSYSHLALQFARTGHIRYDGWGSPSVLFQAVWAALWLQIFPFSFDLLRILTLPFSLGFVALVYLLARQTGLRRDLSFFAALTVGTSPLYLPLAPSFLSDPYGCFFTALCLYAAVRCTQTGSVGWIWTLALAGIAGGFDRQTVWVAPLLLIPYLLFQKPSLLLLKRGRRTFPLHACAAYALTLAALVLLITQFPTGYAPYVLSSAGTLQILATRFQPIVGSSVSFCLTLVVYLLPVSICFFRLRSQRSLILLTLSLLAVTAFVLLFGDAGVAPITPGIQTQFGVLLRGSDALGFKPVLLAPALRFGLSVCALFCAALVLRTPRARLSPVFLVFSAGYLALLFPGLILHLIYDRYLLPLQPLAAMALLVRFQELDRKIPLPAWLALACFAVYGTVTTHDYAASSRSRAAAAHSLELRGIPRSHISAGAEYDGWTQADLTGHVPGLRFGDRYSWNYTSQYWFWHFTSAIQPDFVVTIEARPSARPHLVAIPFRTWLPPFHRYAVAQTRADLPHDRVCNTVDATCAAILK